MAGLPSKQQLSRGPSTWEDRAAGARPRSSHSVFNSLEHELVCEIAKASPGRSSYRPTSGTRCPRFRNVPKTSRALSEGDGRQPWATHWPTVGQCEVEKYTCLFFNPKFVITYLNLLYTRGRISARLPLPLVCLSGS